MHDRLSVPECVTGIALALASWALAVLPARAADAPDVLVIYSNDRLLPANVEVDRGLRDAMAGAPERKVEMFAEFMDRPAFSGPAAERVFATYLRDKYATRPPSAIVLAGGPALAFMVRHRAGLFPGVPIVHLAADAAVVNSLVPLPADVIGNPISVRC